MYVCSRERLGASESRRGALCAHVCIRETWREGQRERERERERERRRHGVCARVYVTMIRETRRDRQTNRQERLRLRDRDRDREREREREREIFEASSWQARTRPGTFGSESPDWARLPEAGTPFGRDAK